MKNFGITFFCSFLAYILIIGHTYMHATLIGTTTVYSVRYSNDSIGVFMRYLCLKIMSVFHITLMKVIINALITDKFLTPAFRIYIRYLFRFVCTDRAYHNLY